MKFLRFNLSCLCVFSLLVLSGFSTRGFCALPADVEQDRYLLAAKRYYDEQRLDRVNEYLGKIEAANKKPPALFYFLKSEVLAHKRLPAEQLKSLEKYVELAGKEGEFYTKALNTITDIEDRRNQAAKPVVKPQLSAADGADSKVSQNEYIQRLQKLYLVDDEKIALVTHINTLLATQSYTGSRMQNSAKQVAGISYSISVDSNQQILTLKRDRSVLPEILTTQALNVFGKGPWLTHDCQYKQLQCTIRLPDSIDPWLVMNYDEKTAGEIAIALEHLIRYLQKTGVTS